MTTLALRNARRKDREVLKRAGGLGDTVVVIVDGPDGERLCRSESCDLQSAVLAARQLGRERNAAVYQKVGQRPARWRRVRFDYLEER